MSSGREAHTTVAIVGAGPAGLVAAHLLHRAGIEYVLLERHPRDAMENLAKAGAMEYRTVELLKSVGIAPSILQFEVTNYCCEFRTPDASVVFDYGTVTGDRPHYVYPQHELVARLCDALESVGGDIRYGSMVTGLEQDDGGVTLSIVDADGGPANLRCQVVAGCDGGRSGVIAGSMRGCEVVEQSLPVRWLAILGTTPPLELHTIYAAHPRGFAGQMRRLPTLTRFYLEVPASDTIADWPEQRVRDELTTRLLVPGRLDEVDFIEPTLVDLRMKMTTPMQDGRVFLAGDAAHVITPAGGKGMNLAIQDAVELAQGLIERFGPPKDGDRLARYSDTRLPAIWRTQAFSRWMLRLILAGSDDSVGEADVGSFGAGLRQGWVSALQHESTLARWFAYAYAGVDPDETSR